VMVGRPEEVKGNMLMNELGRGRVKVLDGGSGRVRLEGRVKGRKERAERAGGPCFCIAFRQKERKAEECAFHRFHPLCLL
jgi:hypothetical protein